jgi:hypothetical protein
MRKTKWVRGSHREYPTLQQEGYSLPNTPPEVCPSRRSCETTPSSCSGLVHTRPSHSEATEVQDPMQYHQQQETCQAVRAHNVNSSSLNDTFKVASVL